MSQSFKSQIAMQVQRYIDIAVKKLGFDEVDFDYDFSMVGKSGGSHRYTILPNGTITKDTLRFNLLMMAQDPEKYLKVVVGHEVAHMVAEHLFGTYEKPVGHGPYWKHVMRVFGLEPARTHDFDVSESSGVVVRKVTKYEVKCDCRSLMITSHRRTKMLNGKNYVCSLCKTRIKLVA